MVQVTNPNVTVTAVELKTARVADGSNQGPREMTRTNRVSPSSGQSVGSRVARMGLPLEERGTREKYSIDENSAAEYSVELEQKRTEWEKYGDEKEV